MPKGLGRSTDVRSKDGESNASGSPSAAGPDSCHAQGCGTGNTWLCLHTQPAHCTLSSLPVIRGPPESSWGHGQHRSLVVLPSACQHQEPRQVSARWLSGTGSLSRSSGPAGGEQTPQPSQEMARFSPTTPRLTLFNARLGHDQREAVAIPGLACRGWAGRSATDQAQQRDLGWKAGPADRCLVSCPMRQGGW